jgi:hypothetical protein
MKNHLIVLTHGYLGSQKYLLYLIYTLSQISDSYLLISQSNESVAGTKYNLHVMGKRLQTEVLEFITDKSDLKYISFIGISLGGLVNRVCIGLGYNKGKIYNLEPLYYISFATPHLGITDSKKIYHTACRVVSKNKEVCFELNLESDFLKSTTEPDSVYFKGLQSFKVRYLFVNIRNDGIVNYNTSSISFVPYNELIHSETRISKHILAVVPVYIENTQLIESSINSDLYTMYHNLNKLEYTRILCDMNYSIGFLGHTKIYASNFLNSKLDGSDIVDYMIDLISKLN